MRKRILALTMATMLSITLCNFNISYASELQNESFSDEVANMVEKTTEIISEDTTEAVTEHDTEEVSEMTTEELTEEVTEETTEDVYEITTEELTEEQSDLISVDEVHFPDELFRNYILNNFADENGNVNINEVTKIDFNDWDNWSSNTIEVHSIKGIEYFTNLIILKLSYVKIDEIDLSSNILLEELSCEHTSSNYLNISNNKKLKILYLDSAKSLGCENINFNNYEDLEILKIYYYEKMGDINFEKNTNLKELLLYDCGIDTIKLDKNVKLEYLRLGMNNITEIDLSKNVLLEEFFSREPNLSEIDLSNNRELKEFFQEDKYKNNLKKLNLKNCSKLESVQIQSCLIEQLDLSDCINLSYFDCSNSRLKSLDLSNCSNIKYLFCNNSMLTSLELPENVVFEGYTGSDGVKHEYFEAENLIININNYSTNSDEKYNMLENSDSFDISKISNLNGATIEDTYLILNDEGRNAGEITYTYKCNEEYSINVMIALVNNDNYIMVDEMHFPDPDFRNYLLKFYADEDGIIDVEKLENLSLDAEGVDMQGNDCSVVVHSLDGLQYLWNLKSISVINQPISTVDVSMNKKLTSLTINGTTITKIDLRKNVALRSLNVNNNKLRSLDLEKNEELFSLYCEGNDLTLLDLSGLSNLFSVNCSNNELSELNLAGVDKLWSLNCESNHLMFLNLPEKSSQVRFSGGKQTIKANELALYNDGQIDMAIISGLKIENITEIKGAELVDSVMKINQTGIDNDRIEYKYKIGERENVADSYETELYVEIINLYTEKYKITYNLDGGKNAKSNPEIYTKYDTIILKNPIKDNYLFLGWYKKANFEPDSKITQISEGTTGDITLYAKWVKKRKSPVINKVESVRTGAKITWTQVAGCTKYRVLRWDATQNKWVAIKLISSVKGTTNAYIDKNVKNAVTYKYAVRCISEDNINISVFSNTMSCKYFKTPLVTSATSGKNGVVVKWDRVSGVTKYVVYRRVPGGDWKVHGYTNTLAYLDKTAVKGHTYYYTVQCVDANKKPISGIDKINVKKVTVK